MADTTKKYRIKQKISSSDNLILHPETDADIVKVATGTGKYPGTATDVQAALKETYELAQTGGVTGVKGNSETSYRTGNVNLTPANLGAQAAFEDGTATIVTSSTDSIVTLRTSVTQINGKVAEGSYTVSLAKVAKTGAYSDLSGKPTLGTAAACNTGTASGNVPVLDSNGKLNTSTIPSIAITDTFTAANQTAMLALAAQKGDVCIRTDVSKTFILAEDGASTLAHWKELATPTDTVTGVKGSAETNYRTGNVSISYSNVGAAAANHNHSGVYQPLDADLTAIAALTGTSGLLRKTAADTWSLDTTTYVKEYATSATTISRTVDGAQSQVVLGATQAGDTKKHTKIGTYSVSDNAGCTIDITDSNATFHAQDSEGDAIFNFTAQEIADLLDKYTASTNTLAVNASTATEFKANKTWTLTGDVTGTASTKGGFSMSTTLKNSGVTAGTYSAVTVNAKGIVTAGGNMFEVEQTAGTGPSSLLATNGLFFELLS